MTEDTRLGRIHCEYRDAIYQFSPEMVSWEHHDLLLSDGSKILSNLLDRRAKELYPVVEYDVVALRDGQVLLYTLTDHLDSVLFDVLDFGVFDICVITSTLCKKVGIFMLF